MVMVSEMRVSMPRAMPLNRRRLLVFPALCDCPCPWSGWGEVGVVAVSGWASWSACGPKIMES